MSLLRDIQDAATASDVGVSVLLRKCLVLATRLGNTEFKTWVDSELSGYKPGEQLPEYRIARVISKGDFFDPLGGGWRNAEIPLTCLREEFRERLAYGYMRQPISYYESLIESADKGATIIEPWPAELLALVGNDIMEGMTCMSARKIVPPGKLVSLVDAVRNRILKFAISIEAEDPDAGDAPLDSNPLPQEKVTQIFHTYISGNVQNVATGSSHVVQTANIAYNETALAGLLRSNGVSQPDIDDLLTAIREDKAANPNPKEIGPKVTMWMAKMFKKTVRGTWKIGAGVATGLIVKAISAYYGLP